MQIFPNGEALAVVETSEKSHVIETSRKVHIYSYSNSYVLHAHEYRHYYIVYGASENDTIFTICPLTVSVYKECLLSIQFTCPDLSYHGARRLSLAAGTRPHPEVVGNVP